MTRGSTASRAQGGRAILSARLRGPANSRKPGGLPPALAKTYRLIRPQIESRLAEFDALWETGAEEDLFAEAAFCLFTPQSKAVSCWSAVEELRNSGLLFSGGADEIGAMIPKVRFRNNKARYLVIARAMFSPRGRLAIRPTIARFRDSKDAREWLVESVKGYGHKEASHFLRNIGRGRDMAILDRHILKNLVRLRVIQELPSSLTKERYLAIEREMAIYAEGAEIPMAHLDFLLWHAEAGSVFK